MKWPRLFPPFLAVLLFSGLTILSATIAFGQDAAPVEPPATESPAVEPAAEEPSSTEPAEAGLPLNTSQDVLASRYRKFELKLLEMAEFMRKSEPDRADLLVRAIGLSKQDRVNGQMEILVELLKNQQLGEAAERQEDVVASLQSILDLLTSEDREKANAREQARIKGYLDKLKKIISTQKDLRAATERGENPDDLIPRQERIVDKTRDLRDNIDKDDEEKKASEGEDGKPSDGESGEDSGMPSDGKPSDGKPSDGKPSDGKPSDGKPSDGKPEDGKPEDGKPEDGKPKDGKPEDGKPSDGKPSDGKPSDGKPSDGKPSDGKPSDGKPSDGKPSDGKPSDGKPSDGKPSDGKPSDGKPSDGKPSDGKPSDGKPSESQPSDSTPGREEIEKARQEMEKAIEDLKQKNHANASEDQDKALKELEAAKEKLEEILRQLREEERDRFLAALEARFQKMLAMQLLIYNDTTQIDKVPEGERASRHTNKSIQLSRQEEELALEATKALTLLQEEGSAVAFPEAVEQMRDDMRLVVARLERVDVGELTQSIELDIIDALKEMIEALQKEMEKKDEPPPPPGEPPPPSPPQDPPLVETLAELKMLRSLQLRINGRTQRLGRLIDGEQATDADVIDQLQKLSDRQSRIEKATYDLATGRNK